MTDIVTSDGTRLFCRRWGEGPPLLFLHGWALSSETWQSAMTLAAQAGFQAIAYDRRGHGRSDDPGRGYDYDTLADDLAAVIEALDLQDVTLIGHSMGAGEIARYLRRHGGGRVSRAVMVSPALPFMQACADNPDGPSDPAQAAEWRALWARAWTEWLGQAVPAAFGPDASPDRVQQTLRIMLQCSPWTAINVNRAVVETDFREELRRLDVPVMVLQGDADQSCPLAATGARLPALVPDCRLKVYAGASHVIIFSHAAQIVEDVAAFASAHIGVAAA